VSGRERSRLEDPKKTGNVGSDGLVSAGIADLVRRYSLPHGAADALVTLTHLLVSDRGAATTIRDEQGVMNDHLADSLVALELSRVRSARAIADLGSGAGLPGLPLAISLPEASVALVESNRRRCEFIARAATTCGLGNTRAVNSRAEAWQEGRESFDLVTARALGPLAVVIEYAAPLLRIGGAVLVWRGARDLEAERSAARAASELGLEPADPLPVHPYPEARQRHLHLMTKVRETPDRFPRRSGMARKRPLGSSR
jgi:16S rRNA (guanine527-N7)-methyltransferase